MKIRQLLKERSLTGVGDHEAYFLISRRCFGMPQFCQPEDWFGFTNMSKGRSPTSTEQAAFGSVATMTITASNQPCWPGVTQGLPQQAAGDSLPDGNRADSALRMAPPKPSSQVKGSQVPLPSPLLPAAGSPGRWWAHHTLTEMVDSITQPADWYANVLLDSKYVPTGMAEALGIVRRLCWNRAVNSKKLGWRSAPPASYGQNTTQTSH